ncbi:hypothetical protein GINT2_002224 [Glugoides intestinalis]
MLGLEKVRGGVKVVFHILQIAIFLSGAMTFILAYLLFTRQDSLIPVPTKMLAPITAISILSVTNGFLGFNCLNSERKTKVFLFILTLAILMNIQIVLAVRSGRIMDHRVEWINDRWSSLSSTQKDFIQRKFRCCGLETINDRAGHGCRYDVPCAPMLKAILRTLRNSTQASLICMFFIESLSLCTLGFLKFIK